MTEYTLHDVLPWSYQAVADAYVSHALPQADWMQYQAVWYYSAPRFELLTDQLPRVREVNALLDGALTEEQTLMFVQLWNRMQQPYVFKSTDAHAIDDTACGRIWRYLRLNPQVTQDERGRVILRTLTA